MAIGATIRSLFRRASRRPAEPGIDERSGAEPAPERPPKGPREGEHGAPRPRKGRRRRREAHAASRWDGQHTDSQWLDFMRSELDAVLAPLEACTVVLIGTGTLALHLQKHLLDRHGGARRMRVVLTALPGRPALTGALLDERVAFLPSLEALDAPPGEVVAVACCTSNRDVHQALRLVESRYRHDFRRFVYLIRASESYPPGCGYVATAFDDPLFESVYEFSLGRCVPKCERVDAADLLQVLEQTSRVEGAIVEFGSYRGHSGLLIAETARRLGLRKPIYLCDTFDRFPQEQHPLDVFWSRTHFVDFAEVQALFRDYPDVRLVRGDFADTLAGMAHERFSLAFVDCDSYRAVRLVSEFVFPRMACGGAVVYEDYGHSFCLGARHAVDEFYAGREDSLCLFSGMSGSLIAVKLRP